MQYYVAMTKHLRRTVLLCAAVFVAAYAGITRADNPPARVRVFATGLNQPVCIASAPGDQAHLFVCERPGRIRVLNTTTGTVSPTPFLDITSLVSTFGDGGLIGMAFDPGYATNGLFYVFYNSTPSPPDDRVLARFHATPGSAVADANSFAKIWQYPRQVGHNGGWIGFSPVNGYLYLSSGDGGNGFSFDAPNRAQTIVNQLMGKILRIDVNGDDFPEDPNRNYRIPPSNPFVGSTGDDEIWALGVRNPWRCSFDRSTGDLYIADVGQDAREEINFEPAASPGGRNYGWKCMEGNLCTTLDGGPGCVCASPALTAPIHEYDHTFGHSVTGGYVYRGAAIPELQGLYFFADFQDARIWTMRVVGGVMQALVDRTNELRLPTPASSPLSGIATFGEDSAGELYLADFFTGSIYKLVPYPCPPVIDVGPASGSAPLGLAIVLTVAGAGTDPLSFRWRKNEVELSDGGRVTGAATPTLTISNVQAGDAGNYDVVLSNSCGSTSSSTAHITVTAPCRADFNGSGGVTIDDLFLYFNAYFQGFQTADFDGVNGVAIDDLFLYINAWFVGC